MMGKPDKSAFRWPACVSEFMSHRDLLDEDFYVSGAARALCWIKVAGSIIEALDNESDIASYHAYVGVSACRTAADALANWLNAHLNLGMKPLQIDFKKTTFRDRVIGLAPALGAQATALGTLLNDIDEHRQRAQHREGLALIFYAQEPGGPKGGWYLTKGLQASRALDQYLPHLLSAWASTIEEAICAAISSTSPATRGR